ncbi:MAG: hypothetical protein RE468_00505 [Acidithiobacillus caldus]|uniref:IS66 family insertion sequence element accessory protein TnpA n=1 Tax=Acidithiobacillus caldus TaxID=33059 RepID=UPI000A72040F|nr:hypothetical protein [Acidithiobacillus caldus]MBU2782660.1 hypothetical protein [Acidithiobacillus caldus]MBU2790823.1 hypothetical protein [Acidithiobacillus caldus]MBU2821544.1 hypothetical protein [Acidithiobacillus caldus]WMT47150.1 MAG: hypothetical protein RE468_00505 [Acidithiobacillus caldus]
MDQGKGVHRRRVNHGQATVDALGNSGLSARRFCAERGLSHSQFYYWRQRLRAVGIENHPSEVDTCVPNTVCVHDSQLVSPKT